MKCATMPRRYDSDDDIRYNDYPEPRMTLDGAMVALHVFCWVTLGGSFAIWSLYKLLIVQS